MAPTQADARVRLADPLAELPIKNFKYVKNCTELYLAKRGITKIAHFEPFVNLEVLWINDNEIEQLDGLDTCFRIKQLYAQNNRIRSLDDSSLRHFKFLQELRLYDNKLRDFPSTLEALGRLHRLEDLDLFGNPIEEEENYRLHVIKAIPSLLVFDRHVITDEERAKAQRLRGDLLGEKRSKSRKKKSEVIAGAPPQTMSGTVKMLFREVKAIQRGREANAKAAAAQEVLEMSKTQQELSSLASHHQRKTKMANQENLGDLDEWELSALEKQFHQLETKKHTGLTRDQLPNLLRYLEDRGFSVICDGVSVVADRHDVLGNLLFGVNAASGQKIAWKDWKRILSSSHLRCEFMQPHILHATSSKHFETASTLQRRLLSISDESTRVKLSQELHILSQRAYHLKSVAEKLEQIPETRESVTPSASSRLSSPQTHDSQLTPRTRFFITSFRRTTSPTVTFHELKEQCAQVNNGMASKYKLHSKDMNKYLLRKAPATSTLVRKDLNL
ncbi:hypothetical protein Poli38472_005667 [Pythium oligandrum]|uniref:Uncharacterized protein n=1 Tax=Pythium oligandrum TaxID=41045 RepID=A0A8K1CHB2_PYTOL|nr:hypothetical protein Poli38472_005667 [Pythium oligandrum]|eukprot:TMW63049.1 hypothetical protein Poli38472_005667 [Pythium oligandrum]